MKSTLGVLLPALWLRSVVSWTQSTGHEPTWTRRDWIGRATGIVISTCVGGSQTSYAAPTLVTVNEEHSLSVATYPSAGQFYFPALTPPFNGRATVRHALGRDAWAFEQLLTFANVTATIRCNVIKLKESGGLWVHSPQWPTGEFCHLLDDLQLPVEHVVLPCNAFEHKAPMQAFLKKYPNAKVWIAPGQFGPLGSCGRSLNDPWNMGYRVDGILGTDIPPWANEFDIATLYVELPKNAGPVSEVAFCHRPTKTLVATDAVIYVPKEPAPAIFSTYFDSTVVNDRTFWARSVLQAIFLPLRMDQDGNYPGYDAVKDRLIRAPILRALVDARAPEAVRKWIDQQTDGQWDFDRIITSHFASPIAATPADLRAAFEYLFSDDLKLLDANLPSIACRDWELLNGINQVVGQANAGAPVVFDFTRGCSMR
jgi:Domain of unknown function (DUF4336)